MIKKLLKNTLPQLAYFYAHLKYRLFVLLVVNIAVGFLDGLGLAMFLPLLELLSDDGGTASTDQMGNLAFILEGLAFIGLPFTLTVILLTLLLFFTLKGAAKWLSSYLNVVYQQFFIRKIRIENIDALSKYSYQAFVKADAGVIQNTMTGEVGRVVQSYRTYTLILQALVMVLTYTALAFLANAQFATLVAVGGLLTNVVFKSLYKRTKTLSRELVASGNAFQKLLIQQVAFFKYLKATGSIDEYARNLRSKVNEIENSVRKIGILDSVMTGVREPLMIGIVVAVILLQVYLFGGLLSTIILSILFFYRGLTAVIQLQTNYNKFLSYSGSLENMNEFVKDLKRNKFANGKKIVKGFSNFIELTDVHLEYESGSAVLNGINLTIQRNETIAIVGESGSGKTTLMNVISGILSPTKGRIQVDGIDYRDADIRTFQRRIGYITQEAVIFDDTIFNNVTFWEEPTEENLQRFYWALNKASIGDVISGHNDPHNTRLGNNGVNLSGGQKQRISIARELYKSTDLLLMDEATSALDSETERTIQLNIDSMKGEYSIIIIAHRLSTIKNADRVVYLKEGEIDYVGTYSALLERSDAFRRMVKLQEL